MSQGTSGFDIKELADLLGSRRDNGQRTVLLLGSRAGGLYRSYNLYDSIKQYSNRSPTSRRDQFAECYELLSHNRFSELDRFSILSQSLKDIPLADADISLAQLVKEKYFDILISTNVDDMLEQAFIEIGMKESTDFSVLIPRRGVDLDVIDVQKNVSCWLIKVFGDLSSRSYNIFTTNVQSENERNESGQLKEFLRRHLKGDILVLSLDPVWDGKILTMFPEAGSQYLFVNEEKFEEHTPIANTWRGRTKKVIMGSEGGYDSFLRDLYWYLGKGKIPGGTHLIRGIHSTLQGMQSELKDISSEVRLMRADLAQLQALYSETERSKD